LPFSEVENFHRVFIEDVPEFTGQPSKDLWFVYFAKSPGAAVRSTDLTLCAWMRWGIVSGICSAGSLPNQVIFGNLTGATGGEKSNLLYAAGAIAKCLKQNEYSANDR
jgi:hypothetical protein